jgi:hypothetical protein
LPNEVVKEIEYLNVNPIFKIQNDLFAAGIENGFSNNEERLRFLSDYKKFAIATRNEYERFSNLYPKSKKKKYYHEGKEFDKKINGIKIGNEVLIKRISEKFEEISEYEDETGEEYESENDNETENENEPENKKIKIDK